MTFPVTVDEFREHVETTLGDDAIQRLLDAAAEAIIERAGPTVEDSGAMQSRVETFTPTGDRLMLSERAESIVSVSEQAHYATPTELETDDYELSASGYVLRRLTGGTTSSSRWRPLVSVTYAPYSDLGSRAVVQIELAKLDIASNPGLASQSVGSWTESYVNDRSYAQQRADILAALHADPVVVF